MGGGKKEVSFPRLKLTRKKKMKRNEKFDEQY